MTKQDNVKDLKKIVNAVESNRLIVPEAHFLKPIKFDGTNVVCWDYELFSKQLKTLSYEKNVLLYGNYFLINPHPCLNDYFKLKPRLRVPKNCDEIGSLVEWLHSLKDMVVDFTIEEMMTISKPVDWNELATNCLIMGWLNPLNNVYMYFDQTGQFAINYSHDMRRETVPCKTLQEIFQMRNDYCIIPALLLGKDSYYCENITHHGGEVDYVRYFLDRRVSYLTIALCNRNDLLENFPQIIDLFSAGKISALDGKFLWNDDLSNLTQKEKDFLAWLAHGPISVEATALQTGLGAALLDEDEYEYTLRILMTKGLVKIFIGEDRSAYYKLSDKLPIAKLQYELGDKYWNPHI
jgi:hypothetical protein